MTDYEFSRPSWGWPTSPRTVSSNGISVRGRVRAAASHSFVVAFCRPGGRFFGVAIAGIVGCHGAKRFLSDAPPPNKRLKLAAPAVSGTIPFVKTKARRRSLGAPR